MGNFIVIMLVKRVFVFLNLFCVVFFATAVPVYAAADSLEIKGAAIYQALGKDYYIASLYVTDASQDALDLLASGQGQQMRIKVIAKRWSTRKWKAQWQNNIAINNVVDIDPELTKAIASFTDFPLNSLRPGDEVVIDYVPNTGTSIYFNSHQVVKSKGKKLYSYLLNTWLGKFSPNRIFRDKIEGVTAPNPELLLRAAEVVSEDRIAEVSTWFVSEEEKRKAKRQQELLIAEELRKQKQDEINKKKALAKEEAEQEAKQKRKQAEELKRKQQQQKSQASSSQKQKNDKKHQQKLAESKKMKTLKHDLAMQDYYQQIYLWQLQSKINESVAYPPWAKQFSHRGLVELTFATDLSGDLLNVVNKTPDTSKILVQEVARRLRLALEVIPRPTALKGERWSFTIKYTFDPTVKELEPLPKPKKPE